MMTKNNIMMVDGEFIPRAQAIEGCWQSTLADVGMFDAEDNARRGMVFVRNFLRNLLQMSARQPWPDFGQADNR